MTQLLRFFVLSSVFESVFVFSVASHRVKAGCWRHQLVFSFISVFVPVFVFVFVLCCVACLTVSRLGVGGVRGSVVTILMAAIPEPSHTVSYTGQPPIYGAIYINTLLYVELLVLYCQLTNSSVRRPFGFHGQCARKPLLHIYTFTNMCVHMSQVCARKPLLCAQICFHKYVCWHVTNMCSKTLLHAQIYFHSKYN